MDANFKHLWIATVEAVELLGQAATPLDPHIHHARAVLAAALQHLYYEVDENDLMSPTEPTEAVPIPPIADDLDSADDLSPAPRSLADYREERGMTVLEFGRWLGIAHFEYAAVVNRRPVDRRIRDQIAYKLGVDWWAIAEFMPEQPQPHREVAPLPARPDAEPPDEPWYFLDEVTGRIRSGPHDEPYPENALHLYDYATEGAAQLIALWDFDWPQTEEDQLPPGGRNVIEYKSKGRNILVYDWMYEDEDDDAEDDLDDPDADEGSLEDHLAHNS